MNKSLSNVETQATMMPGEPLRFRHPIKPELKDWGEHPIAVSIFSSLQFLITIERNVLQPEEALQVASVFIGLFEEKNLE
jgi:hypothetical protein